MGFFWVKKFVNEIYSFIGIIIWVIKLNNRRIWGEILKRFIEFVKIWFGNIFNVLFKRGFCFIIFIN